MQNINRFVVLLVPTNQIHPNNALNCFQQQSDYLVELYSKISHIISFSYLLGFHIMYTVRFCINNLAVFFTLTNLHTFNKLLYGSCKIYFFHIFRQYKASTTTITKFCFTPLNKTICYLHCTP